MMPNEVGAYIADLYKHFKGLSSDERLVSNRGLYYITNEVTYNVQLDDWGNHRRRNVRRNCKL